MPPAKPDSAADVLWMRMLQAVVVMPLAHCRHPGVTDRALSGVRCVTACLPHRQGAPLQSVANNGNRMTF